jgi:hypothetical protein
MRRLHRHVGIVPRVPKNISAEPSIDRERKSFI